MAQNHRETVPVPIADLNRMILLLAGTVLIASIAVFCVVDLTLHQGVIEELLISVIPNITASVFIYIAIYFSLSRVGNLRQAAAQQQLVDAIVGGVRAIIPPGPAATVVESSGSELAREHLRAEQEVIIQRFMEAIYTFSAALTGNLNLRLYCHLVNGEKGTLHPVWIASGTARADYDYRSDIPYTGPESRSFVIAKAMNQRRIVAEDLPGNHRDFYPEELRTSIPASLRCVIAAPIESYRPGASDGPLGTISIDSTSANCAELGFTDGSGDISSNFDIMLKSCARALYQVLKM
jgi:hypothetical protein